MVSLEKYYKAQQIVDEIANRYACIASDALCGGDFDMAFRFARRRERLSRFLVCGEMWEKSQDKINLLVRQGKLGK